MLAVERRRRASSFLPKLSAAKRLEDPRVPGLPDVPQQDSDNGGVNLGCDGWWELRHGPKVPEAVEVQHDEPPSDTPDHGGKGATQHEVVCWVRKLDDVLLVE
jgi:hypothetical protein